MIRGSVGVVPAAAEFQLLSEARVYCYQAGLDPDRLSEQPGTLGNIESIRSAIESGKTGLDFLRGDEPYKYHFRALPRLTKHFRVVPRRQTAQLRHQMWLAGQSMKRWVKRALGTNRHDGD